MSKITLAAVGDISFAKTPEKLFFENPGYDFFAGAAADLARADIRFGNLESVMIPEGFPLEATCGKPLQSSDKLISALKTANFDILNLATNHTLDCGRIGQLNTLAQVKSIGVQPLASGQDSAEAAAMRIVEKNGTRIGFTGFVQAGDWTLAGGGGRIAYLNNNDTIAHIEKCRNLVDVLVVSIHADIEFRETPSIPRLNLFRKIAEAGADLILGHHPHVPQGVERWGSCLINYSLGNFLFDVNGYQLENSENVLRSHIFYVDIIDGKITDWHREYYKINPATACPEKLTGEALEEAQEYYRSLDTVLTDSEKLHSLWLENSKKKLERFLQYRLKNEKNLTADVFIKKYASMLFSDMSCEWLTAIKELAEIEYSKHNHQDYEFKYPYSGIIEN